MKKAKDEIYNQAKGEWSKALHATTIKAEIQKNIILLIAVSLMLVGGLSCWMNYTSTEETLEANMQETAEQAAEQVQYRIKATMNLVEGIGSVARLTNDSVTLEQKRSVLDIYLNKYDWKSLVVTDEKGTSIFNEKMSVGQLKCFKKAIMGETAISDPEYNESYDGVIMMVAAPLWKDGSIDSEVSGVVLAVLDGASLSEVAAGIQVSNNGSAYMINEAGNTIAHEKYDLVVNASNTVEDAKTDSSQKQLAVLETKMANGETGFGDYKYGGVRKFLAYSPVGINGWSLGVSAPVSDFMTATIISIVITVALLLAAMGTAIVVARRLGVSIGRPISQCADRLKLLAEGDLEAPVPDLHTKDETMVLVDSTRTIVERMQGIIGDTAFLLEGMSDGDFTVKTKIGDEAYVGAFKQILLSMRKMNTSLSETLTEIQEASTQVEAGAMQMAESAQNLAEGATDQAGSVEELLATVSEVTVHVEENTEATDHAHDRANVVAKEAKVSQDKMHDLTAAMQKIEETSRQINNIIEGIEDIASQTNLLSLNAAIEAARAGEAGRGFAVVADQIRNLAEQSAESAVDTRRLIEASIAEVNNGGDITRDTAEYLNKVMAGLDEILMAVGGVRRASDKQAAAMKEIEKGVEQISSVVENNSAAAQETSATSEELSAQSESLNSLAGRFHLKKL